MYQTRSTYWRNMSSVGVTESKYVYQNIQYYFVLLGDEWNEIVDEWMIMLLVTIIRNVLLSNEKPNPIFHKITVMKMMNNSRGPTSYVHDAFRFHENFHSWYCGINQNLENNVSLSYKKNLVIWQMTWRRIFCYYFRCVLCDCCLLYP